MLRIRLIIGLIVTNAGVSIAQTTQGFDPAIDSSPLVDSLDVEQLSATLFGPGGSFTHKTQGGPTDFEFERFEFEGIGDLVRVGTLTGRTTVRFGSSWTAILDSDAGGSGSFANEPSPDAVIFSMGSTPDPIDFSTSLGLVEFHYAASSLSGSWHLVAWDGPSGTGNILTTVSGNAIGARSDGAMCQGDPTGDMCQWRPLALIDPLNRIRSVTLEGPRPDRIAFDDLLIGQVPDVYGLFDFEGIPNRQRVGIQDDSIQATFGDSWTGIIDSDAGGTGSFANEPSPDTVIVPFQPNENSVTFDLDATLVQFYYSAAQATIPFVVLGWDGPRGTGQVVAGVRADSLGAQRDGAPCVGDPSGEFCLWQQLHLLSTAGNIRSISFVGLQSNLIGLDDFLVIGECRTQANAVFIPDSTGKDVPNSLFEEPRGDLPFIGSGTFKVKLDDPAGACGITPFSATFLLVSTKRGNSDLPGFGCDPGDHGRLMVSPTPWPLVLGPLSWLGSGAGATYNLPIPSDPLLCGQEIFLQGLWFDLASPSAPGFLSGRLELTLGL